MCCGHFIHNTLLAAYHKNIFIKPTFPYGLIFDFAEADLTKCNERFVQI